VRGALTEALVAVRRPRYRQSAAWCSGEATSRVERNHLERAQREKRVVK